MNYRVLLTYKYLPEHSDGGQTCSLTHVLIYACDLYSVFGNYLYGPDLRVYA